MRRGLYTPPDSFSSSPLLSLLPVKGKIEALAALSPSLYARYEKVLVLQREMKDASTEHVKRLNAEEAMLKQVLDWLAAQPQVRR